MEPFFKYLLFNLASQMVHLGFREVTEDGLRILDNSVVAMGGWLEHVIGLARRPTKAEFAANPKFAECPNPVNLIDGNHRDVYIENLYVNS